MSKRLTQDELQALVWQRFLERRQWEDAGASVALSHPPDCDCELCQRVRARLAGSSGSLGSTAASR